MVLLPMLATVLTQAPPPASADDEEGPCTTRTYTPTYGARFNNPQGDDAQKWALMNPLIDSICSTPKGAVIRIAIFSISVERFADALIEAHQRGVHVQVLMDAHAQNGLWRRLAGNLNTRTSASDKSFAKTCPGGCLTWYEGSSLHAKIYMFSTAGKAKAVTVLSSANPTNSQALVASNNNYTNVESSTKGPLYTAHRKYFEVMTAAATDSSKRNFNYYRSAANSSGTHRVWFFPRSGYGNSNDTVWNTLDNVGCSKTASRTSTVRIAMFQWTAGRKNIADKLVSMGKAGCKIDILWTAGAVDSEIKTALASKTNVRVSDTSVDVNGDGTADHYTHNKYWLIDGFYNGSRVKYSITGSVNFTSNGQRWNNEVMERLTSTTNYNAFLNDWNAVRSRVPDSVTSQKLTTTTAKRKPLRIRPEELLDS